METTTLPVPSTTTGPLIFAIKIKLPFQIQHRYLFLL